MIRKTLEQDGDAEKVRERIVLEGMEEHEFDVERAPVDTLV